MLYHSSIPFQIANSGRIEHSSEVEVKVLLQAMREAVTRCCDKFLVHSVTATPDRDLERLTKKNVRRDVEGRERKIGKKGHAGVILVTSMEIRTKFRGSQVVARGLYGSAILGTLHQVQFLHCWGRKITSPARVKYWRNIESKSTHPPLAAVALYLLL